MALNQREKRTVRLASILVGAYLIIFGGLQLRGYLGEKGEELTALRQELAELESASDRRDLDRRRVLRLERELGFSAESSKASSGGRVAATTAEIERLARQLEIDLGPHGELSSRLGSGELARLDIQATGSLGSLSRFLKGVESSGHPVVVRRMDLRRLDGAPGRASLTMSLGVLDVAAPSPGGAADV